MKQKYERKNRCPNGINIRFGFNRMVYLDPIHFTLREAKKLHDWSGRLVAHLEMWKEREKGEK